MSKLLLALIATLLFNSVTSQSILVQQQGQQQTGRARCQMPIDTGSCGALYILSLNNPTQRLSPLFPPVFYKERLPICSPQSSYPGNTPRYAYDRISRGCVQFTYSGCGGNRNNFVSYQRCMTTCNPTQSTFNQLVNLVQYALTGQSG